MKAIRAVALATGVFAAVTLLAPVPANANLSSGRGAFSAGSRTTTRRVSQRSYHYAPTNSRVVRRTTRYVPTSYAPTTYGSTTYGSSEGATVTRRRVRGADGRVWIERRSTPSTTYSRGSTYRGSTTYRSSTPRSGVTYDSNGQAWIQRGSSVPSRTVSRSTPRTTRIVRSTASGRGLEYDESGRAWVRRYVTSPSSSGVVASGSPDGGSSVGSAARTLRDTTRLVRTSTRVSSGNEIPPARYESDPYAGSYPPSSYSDNSIPPASTPYEPSRESLPAPTYIQYRQPLAPGESRIIERGTCFT